MYVPNSHGIQAEMDELPEYGLYFPIPHDRQDTLPLNVLYVPGAQEVQAELPGLVL